jgi:uncharacterized FlaG/YvyC family protein
LDVKVTGFKEMFQINRTLKAHAEGGEGHGAPGYEHQNRRHPNEQPSEQQPEPQNAAVLSPEQERNAVEKAVSDFETDAQSQQHGLKASISGTSPGLRVVLSDVNGNVIRQFEAQEFMRLRSTGARDSRGRGKLLDQKY